MPSGQKNTSKGEPAYIKLYIGAVDLLLEDSIQTLSPLLFALLQKMDTAAHEQRIILNMEEVRRICKTIDISLPTYYKQIKRLVDADILRTSKTDSPCWSGTFFVNSSIFSRGNWEDIRKLRLEQMSHCDAELDITEGEMSNV